MRNTSVNTASAVGSAVATIIWVLIAALSPGTFDDTAITALTGASATVIGFLIGLWFGKGR
jgi:hypothetical protein